MMNYELFKEVVADKILGYMSPEYQNSKVDIRSVTKVNQNMDGLNLIPMEEGSSKEFPTIYVNNMYEHYKECNDLDEVLKAAATAMEKAFHQMPDISHMFDFEKVKNNIVMQLVNTEQNKEMLENLPHREFQDLSIIYRWMVDKDSESIASAVIDMKLAEKMNLNEEQLFQTAVVNTKSLFPPTIRSLDEVMRDIFEKDGMPKEIADLLIEEMPEDQMMYVISNDRGINGAASMLYEEGLHELAEKIGSDLYIMPSSLHEVIAVSTNMGDPNELAQMVAEVNMDAVSLDERLSNQVYHYDKDLRTLSLATDTPNKRLDGIASEINLIYDSKSQSR